MGEMFQLVKVIRNCTLYALISQNIFNQGHTMLARILILYVCFNLVNCCIQSCKVLTDGFTHCAISNYFVWMISDNWHGHIVTTPNTTQCNTTSTQWLGCTRKWLCNPHPTPPPQKFNSSICEPQNNIHCWQLNIMWSATTSRAQQQQQQQWQQQQQKQQWQQQQNQQPLGASYYNLLTTTNYN